MFTRMMGLFDPNRRRQSVTMSLWTQAYTRNATYTGRIEQEFEAVQQFVTEERKDIDFVPIPDFVNHGIEPMNAIECIDSLPPILNDERDDSNLNIDLTLPRNVRMTLSHWLNVLKWNKCVNPEGYANNFQLSHVPNVESIQTTNQIISDMQSHSRQNQLLFAEMIASYMLKSNQFNSIMGGRMSTGLNEWLERWNRVNNNNPNQILHHQSRALVNDMFEEKVECEQFRDPRLRNRAPNAFEPLELSDHKWYPCGSKWWAQQWRLQTYGKQPLKTFNTNLNTIASKEGMKGKDENGYCPTNWVELDLMHKLIFCKRDIYVINATVHEQKKNKKSIIETIANKKYAYDSIASELLSMYECPFHRAALTAPLPTFIEWNQQNPLHSANREESAPIHSVQTEMSRYFLFYWLQKFVFIVNPNVEQTRDCMIGTIKILPGTFIVDMEQRLFGLVADVLGREWTIQFEKGERSTLDYIEYLTNELQLLASGVDRLSNELMHPNWELCVLQLQWRYEQCVVANHSHFNEHDQQLFLEVPDNVRTKDDVWNQMLVKIAVHDQLLLGDLEVNGGIITFEDPNSHLRGYSNTFQAKWQLNLIFFRNVAIFPLQHLGLRDFFICIKCPFRGIWPGQVRSPHKTPHNQTVCLYTYNADGYNVSTSENNPRVRESIKNHYISLHDYLLKNKMVSSIGAVVEDSNNTPFYEAMTTDIINCMFRGVRCEDGLVVYGLCALQNSDGKEVVSTSGRIGARSDRNDYMTSFSRLETIETRLAKRERHFKHMISQNHINYSQIAPNAYIPIYMGMEYNLRKGSFGNNIILTDQYKKQLANYLENKVELIRRKAGSSLSGLGLLYKLPSANLNGPETTHLIISGLLSVVAVVTQYSLPGWRVHKSMSSYYNRIFKNLSKSKYYGTSLIHSTYLGAATTSGLKTSKAINTFTSVLHLALFGSILGVDPNKLKILQKLVRWFGVYYSPLLGKSRMQWLVNECDQICEMIENDAEMNDIFLQKQTIPVWRNLVHLKMYWDPIANDYDGMAFEMGNKKSRFHNIHYVSQRKNEIIIKYSNNERCIKDFEFDLLSDAPSLGTGFRQLFEEDTEYNWRIHKLLKYRFNPLDESFEINLNHENGPFISRHIKLMKVSAIPAIYWEKLCEAIGHDGNTTPAISRRMRRSKVRECYNQIEDLIDYLFISNDDNEAEQIRTRFIQCLQNGTIQISSTNGFGLLWREFNDSVLRCDHLNQDMVWGKSRRRHIENFVMHLTGIWIIEGIYNDNFLSARIDASGPLHPESCMICVGEKWKTRDNADNLNYTSHSIESSPVVEATEEVFCCDVNEIISKMFIVHDHIAPTKHDMRMMYHAIEEFPPIEALFLKHENEEWEVPDGICKYWCGWAIQCMCPERRVNCQRCSCDPGRIIISCVEDLWPFYRLYSIFQGCIWRYLSATHNSE